MEEKDYPVCLRCGRKLRTEQARKIGMGKTCLAKSAECSNRLFVPKISRNEENIMPKRLFTDETLHKVLIQYNQGMRISTIAAHMGCNTATLRAAVFRYRDKLRKEAADNVNRD